MEMWHQQEAFQGRKNLQVSLLQIIFFTTRSGLSKVLPISCHRRSLSNISMVRKGENAQVSKISGKIGT